MPTETPKKPEPPYVNIVMPNGQSYLFDEEWTVEPFSDQAGCWGVEVEKVGTKLTFYRPTILEEVDECP